MKRICIILVLICVMCFSSCFMSLFACTSCMYACEGDGYLSDYENVVLDGIGLDVTGAEVIKNLDTHGGWLGDGETQLILKFKDDYVLDQILGKDSWSAIPYDETVRDIIYGGGQGLNDPYFKDIYGDSVVPEIKNGYYILRDRLAEKLEDIDERDKSIFDRSSFNFTLVIYDTDTRILYFLRYDT